MDSLQNYAVFLSVSLCTYRCCIFDFFFFLEVSCGGFSLIDPLPLPPSRARGLCSDLLPRDSHTLPLSIFCPLPSAFERVYSRREVASIVPFVIPFVPVRCLGRAARDNGHTDQRGRRSPQFLFGKCVNVHVT